MKRLLLIPILLLGFGSSAQVPMAGTGNYTQDFNTLANTGTTNPWTDNTTILNWYSQRSGTGAGNYIADAGTSTNGTIYSYGTTATTERAFGSIGSNGAGNFAHGILFQNTSGGLLSTFTVSYALEQWRNGNNATAQDVTFWYKVSSSSFTTLNPGVNTGWTQVSGLTTSSQINTTTAGALDGNLAANRVALSNILISGLTLNAGEYIMFKWEDPNHGGNDHGLAIDDVTISWASAVTCNTTSTINVSACQTYTVPSNDETYVTSGTYMDTIPNAAMCDSIITINLTIKNTTTSTINPTACGTYTVPSGDETYTISGTYMDTIPNAANCDSIITINLTIVGSITYYQDLDTDGFGNAAVSQSGCAPIAGYVTNDDDCDDTNASIGLGTTYYADTDTDGFGDPNSSQVSCTPVAGHVTNDDDCDDTNNTIGLPMMYYVDADGDTYGDASATGVPSCTTIAGSVTNNTDCNDNNAAVYPGATEIPNNGIDEDCNGSDLNTLGSNLAMYEFTGHACLTPNVAVTAQPANAVFSNYASAGVNCASGTNYYNNDGWNMTATIDLTEYNSFKITPASCYALDLNQVKFLHRVSGSAGTTATAHLRSSLDGFATDLFTYTFVAPLGTDINETVNLSSAFDAIADSVEFRFYITGMGAAGTTYRNDNVIVVGNINALTPTTYYADADGDGFGNPAVNQSACSAPAGYVLDNTDCDDTNEDAYPGAVWFQDTDGDGLGNSAVTLTQCTQPANYVADNTDCDDTDDQIGSVVMYYVDADNDGFGDADDTGTSSCAPIAGSVTNNDDCDDNDEDINPSATEVCDGVDNNCDGDTDEGFTVMTYYEDADNDTYGDATSSVQDCAQPTGYVTNDDDCDDTNAAIHPGATDNTGNGVDENCDGVDGMLGIEETILANLNVYPNPGTSSVVLNMNNGWNGFQVTFAGVDGKEISLTSVQKSANELEFNTDSLVSGVYFIRLISTEGTALVRWVKN
ncbi:MAG: MopE-related protein [Fluviicola sp.]